MSEGTIYSFTANSSQGEEVKLSQYQDKVVLIVNTASKCGFTPQYRGLEELYQKYRDRGFALLAFPCNQFGGQEPGTDSEIAEFCELNYHTHFPLFAKVKVNGPEAHPLFTFLREEAPGLLGSEAIKWNFTKFLINRQGQPVQRFAPKDTPEAISGEIEALI